MNEIDLLMNLNMLLKLGNLICAHVGFANFIYKTLDICRQQKIVIIIIIIIHVYKQKYIYV